MSSKAMPNVEIFEECEYEEKCLACRQFFINELNFIADNCKTLRSVKQNATDSIERSKFKLRQKYDPIKLLKDGMVFEKRVSVRYLQNILAIMDRDIGLIQNQFDIAYNDLTTLKNMLEKNLKQVEKAELAMNMLNYKMYDIQYNFMTRIDEITARRKWIESSKRNESQIALDLVDLGKELAECETSHDVSFKVVKEQKLEAQEAYENIVGTLDDILEIFKKHYNNLQMLLEAEKSFENTDEFHTTMVEEIDQNIEQYTKMQVHGWKPNVIKNISDFAKNLKLTPEGLLQTKEGRRLTYSEVQSERLLDFMEIFQRDFVEKVSSDTKQSREKRRSSVSSSEDKMSSEDVCYLKERLGMPLTLALAEITAVQPRDPIHYLGHWLFKYRYNQEIGELKKMELQELLEGRRVIAEERWHSFVESEARAAVVDMITKAEEEATKNEFIRIAKEIEAEEYAEDLEDEARDKFEEYQ